MNVTMHEDYFLIEWFKRYNQQPEEIKKKLDKLAKKIHLLDHDLFFEEFDGEIHEGDIFVIQVQKGKYLYGKVFNSNVKITDKETKIQSECIVLFYKQATTILIMPTNPLNFEDLLLRPQLTTNGLLTSGFAKIIGNIPLTEEEKKIDMGFLNRYTLTIINDNNDIKREEHMNYYNINGEIKNYEPKIIGSTKVRGFDIIYDIARELIIDPSILGEEYVIPTKTKQPNMKKLIKEYQDKNKMNVERYNSILNNDKFTEKKDDFYFKQILGYTEESKDKDAIIIFEHDTIKYVDYINNHNIDNVIIEVVEGGIESLDFLLDVPHIKHLIIKGKIDYLPIYQLKNLKSLTVSGDSQLHIDKIEGLEFLVIYNPNNMVINKEVLTLKTLIISSECIKTKYNNLQFLEQLINLDTLVLEFTSIESLDGIEYLKNLKFLTLVYNRRLYNIDALARIDNLSHIMIEYCNKIENFDAIGSHKQLVFLGLNSIKNVPSIKFLTNCSKLKSFVFVESNVIDGDMTTVINLQEVAILPVKRHYYKVINGEQVKVKEGDFSYGDRDWGKDDIDLWRRLDNRY